MAFVSTRLPFNNVISALESIKVPQHLSSVKDGWLTQRERALLYCISYLIDGPFLEVGSWAGLSTTIIAKGIADSGCEKRFVTAELNPTTSNFRHHAGGIGFFVPPESEECLGLCSAEDYHTSIYPIINRPGGVISLLRENLMSENVAHLVRIHVGDFRTAPLLEYKFIFSDACHNVSEIENSMEGYKRLMRGKDTVFACHDTNDENRAYLCNNLPVVSAIQADSLFICEVDGTKIF